MKRKDLDQLLMRAGYIIKPDNPHDKAVHPDKPNHRITIPKHKEVDNYTAKAILKQAGIKEATR
ncbi:MAG: type II toxin-antitoxin system HicA family toxin [Oscillospiraceae bacterium]|jgi:predicted RNA binding protein YcfA (HicA-like mRNA interferase family)|nr:type II toxin-antitoxin system HicA family toxin [Oscillospiraceae bacterium]